MNPATISELVYSALGACFLAFEIFAVVTEKQTGFLPLTRIVRDRLMAKHRLVRYAVLFLLAWLGLHFFGEGPK